MTLGNEKTAAGASSAAQGTSAGGSAVGTAAPVCLIIMDGYGLEPASAGNAISLARTPHLDNLFAHRPWTSLAASGEAVGLPEGQMGNSEVGHLNIGAGRVVYQELTRINRACADGSLASNTALVKAFEKASQPDAALHLMGLLSDGGVHSSNEHLYALMHAAKAAGVRHVMIHCFMDGRDVPPSSGAGFVAELQGVMDELAGGGTSFEIASIEGRYYAMDRDNRWPRVEKAYRAIVEAVPMSSCDPAAFMAGSYAEGVTDEFVVPGAFSTRGVHDGDAVVFFNFRPDRARELSRAFVEDDFECFERGERPRTYFVCLTEYDPSLPASVAFPKEFPEDVFADVLAANGLSQYHIAETEKYAHVTFFFNGGREEPKEGERRVLVASPSVATYDLQPEMSEPEVARTLARDIDAHAADVYIVNFANCDMVGHTGVISAAVAAVEAVDKGVGQVLAALERVGGTALVTADHGNADRMLADDGTPFTAHTTAKVPLVLVDYAPVPRTLDGTEGALCDIAPSLLALLGIEQPDAMTGRSLVCSSCLG